MSDPPSGRGVPAGAPGIPVSRRGALLVLGGALAVMIGFALWNRPQAPPAEPRPSPEVVVVPVSAIGTAPALVTVHVSGAVATPGLVVLPDGSRVADAVAGVGGALPGSELRLVNLAAPVTDGMHLDIPWAGDRPGAVVSASSGAGSSYPIDLNRADQVALTGIPGVGEVLALRIVAHREAHGPFMTTEDLLDVPGIGEGRLAGMRDYVEVGR
ncbi:MAG: helix-hairpin-helix domain-containing protein [bacterium]|nr:helix-hairpin-helix domain-containing protein [bacterium]